MIEFNCAFECETREDATHALLEIINRIHEDYHSGFLNYADGSWSCIGEDEEEDK